MNPEIYTQNASGKVFDVSWLCVSAVYDTHMYGQPGRLIVELLEDPSTALDIVNGGAISMKIDGKGLFYGYIFTINIDERQTRVITAYDQSRYLKNDDVFTTPAMTADAIFENCCRRAGLFKFEARRRPGFICPEYFHDKKSLYSIINYGIERTFETEGTRLFVWDDFGTLVFDDVENRRTDVVIGDASLLYEYKSETSIDKDTFNLTRVYKDDERSGKRIVWEKGDDTAQRRWGVLSYVLQAEKDMNAAQIARLAEGILKVKNRETRSISLKAIGDARVTAGTAFTLNISKIGLNGTFLTESVTHRFSRGTHTMDMEVFGE
jgi:hypothetical protein